MAEMGISLDLEPVARRDPVTGRTTIYVRRRHNLLRSARQVAFRQCVGEELRGHHFYAPTHRERALLTRRALTAAAHDCARHL
jgi:hypothetical protein